MRLGVLDVGSNSVKLQVIDGRAGAPPLPTSAFKDTVRLAESTDRTGRITDDGAAKLAHAIQGATTVATEQGVTELIAFATAALRDASNGPEICGALEREAGVPLQTLAGEDEARFAFLAAHRWFGWSAGQLLLLDIGGGSLEIAYGRDEQPALAVSLPLGAGRLTHHFLHADPPRRSELKRLQRHVRHGIREVADRLRWEGVPSLAVATSKTFKQLARVTGAPPERKGPFARRVLRRGPLDRWTSRLAHMDISERGAVRGVSRSRAQQILAGALVAREVMRALDLDEVEICPWALREGILLRRLDHLHHPAETHDAAIIATATLTADPDRTSSPADGLLLGESA
jgi:exopolyphosphatase/guanosine-5'-triphosphate,3'-diphosphate pyrophosphatase